MEIINYESMLDATKIIKNIADTAVEVGTKNLLKINGDAITKMSQYIYETIRPIIDSPVGDFTVSDCMYTESLSFRRNANWGPDYKAQLRNNNLGILVYFSKDGYCIKKSNLESVVVLVGHWTRFKENLNTTIKEAISKYNKTREIEVSNIAHLSDILEGFNV